MNELKEEPRAFCGLKTETVVVVRLLEGDGTEGNPLRQVDNYYTKDGKLLAEGEAILDFSSPEQG